MTEKLDYRWHLREVMATRGLFTTISLQPLLAERGIELSTSQIHRLVTERPERSIIPKLRQRFGLNARQAIIAMRLAGVLP